MTALYPTELSHALTVNR